MSTSELPFSKTQDMELVTPTNELSTISVWKRRWLPARSSWRPRTRFKVCTHLAHSETWDGTRRDSGLTPTDKRMLLSSWWSFAEIQTLSKNNYKRTNCVSKTRILAQRFQPWPTLFSIKFSGSFERVDDWTSTTSSHLFRRNSVWTLWKNSTSSQYYKYTHTLLWTNAYRLLSKSTSLVSWRCPGKKRVKPHFRLPYQERF